MLQFSGYLSFLAICDIYKRLQQRGLGRWRVFWGHYLYINWARWGPEQNLTVHLLTFL